MENLLKVITFNTKTSELLLSEMKDELEAFYSFINTDMVEMPERKIGGKYFNIICDEEGLLKSNLILSAYNKENNTPDLVGNLIITGMPDDDGNLTSVENADIDLIRNNMGIYISKEGKPRKAILTSY